MPNRNRLIIIASIVAVVLALVGGVLVNYFQRQGNVNYLISGVPYYGVYYFLLTDNPLPMSAIASITGYWGDSRFPFEKLLGRFDNKEPLTSKAIENFFKENGYETYRWGSVSGGEEIRQIKQFVNSTRKIPVIIYQKNMTDPQTAAVSAKVVVGVFDDAQKVVLHDYHFGSNYEVSYDEFLRMFQSNMRALVAAWPGKELAKQLSANDRPSATRHPVMDSMGKLFALKSEAWGLAGLKKWSESKKIFENILNDPLFAALPPAYKINFYSLYAQMLTASGEPDAAIAVLRNDAIPLNHDLNQPQDGFLWQVNLFKFFPRSDDRLITPYMFLANAYAAKGDTEKARESLGEVLRIEPANKQAEARISSFK